MGTKENRWPVLQDPQRLEAVQDVRRAEKELEVARWRFHDAVGQDQVDYAIFALEAAEKKLDMLLRRAKAMWGADRAAIAERGDAG